MLTTEEAAVAVTTGWRCVTVVMVVAVEDFCAAAAPRQSQYKQKGTTTQQHNVWLEIRLDKIQNIYKTKHEWF